MGKHKGYPEGYEPNPEIFEWTGRDYHPRAPLYITLVLAFGYGLCMLLVVLHALGD